MSLEHLDDLRTQARYAHERYQLYRAKTFGQRPTSPARLLELQREDENAQARLRAAEAEQRRLRLAARGPALPVPPPPDGSGGS